jgi:hypothetical protein
VKLHAEPQIVIALWDLVPFVVKPQLYAGVRFDTTPTWATCDDSYQVVYGLDLALAVDDIKIPASAVENIPAVAGLANVVIVGGTEFAKFTIIGETPFSVEGCGQLCSGCLNQYEANTAAFLEAACIAPSAAPGVRESSTCAAFRPTSGLAPALIAVIIVVSVFPLVTLIVVVAVIVGVLVTRTARRVASQSELNAAALEKGGVASLPKSVALKARPPPKPGSARSHAGGAAAPPKPKALASKAPPKPAVSATGLRPSILPTGPGRKVAPPKPGKPAAAGRIAPPKPDKPPPQ